MTHPTNMRFAHFQQEGKNYNGMTVAYTRTEENLFFSYSLCANPDMYVKSIGRKLTTDTYMMHIDDIHHDVTYVDTTKRVGCISIHTMRDILSISSITNIIADHVVDNLTFMDIKHAALQKNIIQFILLRM